MKAAELELTPAGHVDARPTDLTTRNVKDCSMSDLDTTRPELTAERARELLAYDPDTGVFRWRRYRGRMAAGFVAGSLHDTTGYLRVRIDGRGHFPHRLAFLVMLGRWPADEVDHIDGNRANNAWSNLRECARGMNSQNQRGAQRGNKSGFLGVQRNGVAWRAVIQVDGQRKHLGQYDTPENAHRAYLRAKRELHPGNTL